ncbi:Fe-S biogenesis protein NfuA [Candidatus Profftia sp. (ex Adelges kitamiensis)]|uniref:Fe-S biogenesis protein NfuA n=1 Tax=Candidatus Profftia sp. (ex Adelges kitamiensis) TaxID=2864218 RepID=UPI001CE2D9E1|nr:Fe-S biogenesis protein NfuA [Candidatus Profftia sp. (ex Adelges kitamiensis)]
MIYITKAAEEHIILLLKKQKSGTQIRIFVINPGTSNAECGISYCPLDTVKDSDTKLDFQEISAYIDNISAPYLEGAKIDLTCDKLGSQLTLKAPKAKLCQLDDNASLKERVEYMLQVEINPQLANHGGIVLLIEITQDNIAILKFSGGCNGCSMVSYTLKDGIEKELLRKIPELRGVRDITDHKRSKHSYY